MRFTFLASNYKYCVLSIAISKVRFDKHAIISTSFLDHRVVRRLTLQATYSVDCGSLSHPVTRATLTSMIRQHYDEVDSVCLKGTVFRLVNFFYLKMPRFWCLPERTLLVLQVGVSLFPLDQDPKSDSLISLRFYLWLLEIYRELYSVWKGESNSFHVLIV